MLRATRSSVGKKRDEMEEGYEGACSLIDKGQGLRPCRELDSTSAPLFCRNDPRAPTVVPGIPATGIRSNRGSNIFFPTFEQRSSLFVARAIFFAQFITIEKIIALKYI